MDNNTISNQESRNLSPVPRDGDRIKGSDISLYSNASSSALLTANYTLPGSLFFLQSYFRSCQNEKESWEFEKLQLLDELKKEKSEKEKISQELNFLRRRNAMLENSLRSNVGIPNIQSPPDSHINTAKELVSTQERLNSLRIYLDSVLSTLGQSINTQITKQTIPKMHESMTTPDSDHIESQKSPVSTTMIDFESDRDSPILELSKVIKNIDEIEDIETGPIKEVMESMRVPSNACFDLKCMLRGHLDQVSRIMYIQEDGMLLSFGADGLIKCWNVSPFVHISDNCEPYVTLYAHQSSITFSLFTIHNHLLLTTSDDMICLWNLPTPNQRSSPYLSYNRSWLLQSMQPVIDNNATSIKTIKKMISHISNDEETIYSLTNQGSTIHKINITRSDDPRLSPLILVYEADIPWADLVICENILYGLNRNGQVLYCNISENVSMMNPINLASCIQKDKLIDNGSLIVITTDNDGHKEYSKLIVVAIEQNIFIWNSSIDHKIVLLNKFIAHHANISIICSYKDSKSLLLLCGSIDGSISVWDLSNISNDENIKCIGVVQAHRELDEGVTSMITVENTNGDPYLWTSGSDWLIKLYGFSRTRHQ